MSAGDFGARFVAPGQVQFRLWAPHCEAVSVVVNGKAAPMARGAYDVFETIIACEAGARYKFRISDDLAVPDPASRLQSGDVHDDSVVVDHNYDWRHTGWRGRPWEETVIYELHPGALGGFSGIARDLPRLQALGITAIELMPIADFPGRHNWGYDGVLPYAPDAAYGTPDELKAMIDTAHGLGLMVFLDVVYNHFGPDGNYLNNYAAGFFREDIHTPWGGAIDLRRPQVRRFFVENALYWLRDYRFDGLRFDAVHEIKDDSFLTEMAAEIRASFGDRHVHLVLENGDNESQLLRATPEAQSYDAQWTDDWHHCMHVLLTGEIEGYFSDFEKPTEQFARCLGEGFAYQGEISVHAGGVPRGTPSGQLPPSCFVIFLQNHDQIGNRAMGERLTTLVTPAALRAATALLLLTPQIPLLFMGDEWGEQNPFLFFTDHHDELAEAVREGRRKEFMHFAAFTDAQKRKKIPDPNAHATYVASKPLLPAQPTQQQIEILALYETCLALRARHIVPHLAGARSLGAQVLGEKSVRAAWRLGDGSRLTIAVNLGAQNVTCEAGDGELLFGMWDGALPPFTTCLWVSR